VRPQKGRPNGPGSDAKFYTLIVIYYNRREVEMNGGAVASIMGVLIIITGIALIGVQVMESSGSHQIQNHTYQLIGAEAGSTRLEIETAFPGVTIIALGVILLIAGAIVGR
jgi:hypothetical protein